MRQVVLQEPGNFVESHVSAPKRPEREALLRVRRVGVCGTDLHSFEGRMPFFNYPRILGHEISAEVLEAPANDRGIGAGDACAVEPYLSCGECHACKLGKPNCCERLRVLGVHTDGAMRGMMTVSVERLHKSEKLSFDQLALVEPLSIGAHAVARSDLRVGEDVLVVGAGPIGLATTQFALAAGGRVRVVEPNLTRRAFASRFGVETACAADGRQAEVVFDATGNAKAMEQSFSLVAHGGRLVFVGLVQASVSFDDPSFHRRELTVLASRNSANDFPRIIGMMEQGVISTTPWITHRMCLAEVRQKFQPLAKHPQCIKAMVEVTDQDI